MFSSNGNILNICWLFTHPRPYKIHMTFFLQLKRNYVWGKHSRLFVQLKSIEQGITVVHFWLYKIHYFHFGMIKLDVNRFCHLKVWKRCSPKVEWSLLGVIFIGILVCVSVYCLKQPIYVFILDAWQQTSTCSLRHTWPSQNASVTQEAVNSTVSLTHIAKLD